MFVFNTINSGGKGPQDVFRQTSPQSSVRYKFSLCTLKLAGLLATLCCPLDFSFSSQFYMEVTQISQGWQTVLSKQAITLPSLLSTVITENVNTAVNSPFHNENAYKDLKNLFCGLSGRAPNTCGVSSLTSLKLNRC
uniref:Uncharacterized protein n=1 Tax=Zonotrichia albicollis TaxID=44394 RepID=A0A8D2QD46_ZONAL